MEPVKLKIGEREIPLRFKMSEFALIEEEVGSLADIKALIMEGRQRAKNLIAVIRIMGNAGLKAAGEAPDLTDEWLGENMQPTALLAYQVGVLAVMTEEGRSEADEERKETEERDLVLEEIQKKKEAEN